MDVFAALYILKGKKQLNHILIEKWYERGLKLMSKDILENRIGEIQDRKIKPDFNMIR